MMLRLLEQTPLRLSKQPKRMPVRTEKNENLVHPATLDNKSSIARVASRNLQVKVLGAVVA